MQILIIGAGKSAMLFAPLFARYLGWNDATLYTRPTPNGHRFRQACESDGKALRSFATPHLEMLTGKATLSRIVFDPSDVSKPADIVILSTPASDYGDLISAFNSAQLLSKNAAVICMSSVFGTTYNVESALQHDQSALVMSSYPALTVAGATPNSARTVAWKTHIAIAKTGREHNVHISSINTMLGSLGLRLDTFRSPLETERLNTNLYHLPLACHPEVLRRILTPGDRSFLYRFWPEGNWRPDVFESSVRLESEANEVFCQLGMDRMNYLKFRLERYPVPDGLFANDRIERYPDLPLLERAYLHCCFLWARQVDPAGERNEAGDLPDHNRAVRLPNVRVVDGVANLPRIPAEDVEQLWTFIGLARALGTEREEMERIMENFQTGIREVPGTAGYTLNYDSEAAKRRGLSFAQGILAKLS